MFSTLEDIYYHAKYRIADLFHMFCRLFMSDICYIDYFVKGDFQNGCHWQILSKMLGMAIIGGSMLVKIPQVLKLYKNKSGEGINLMSVMLDLTAITFHMSYSFMNSYPFSSWGDNLFLALQTAAIGALVLLYTGRRRKAITFCIGYALIVLFLNSNIVDPIVLTAAQSLIIPILLAGKLSQAWTNYKNGSTGQLSGVTITLLFAGSLARIFTSFMETGDKMIIATFLVSSFANCLIFAQLLWYWNKKEAKPVKSKSKAKSGAKTATKHKKAD